MFIVNSIIIILFHRFILENKLADFHTKSVMVSKGTFYVYWILIF